MTTTLARLEEAVYANLDDDEVRAVYADALLDAGDPRGELIQLQLHPARGDAQRAREQHLIAHHAKTWLGPLHRVLAAYRFERGFLAAATVAPRRQKAIAALVGHPRWQTVSELTGSLAIALHPSLRALRVLDVMTLDWRRDAWRALLVDTPRPIEKLSLAGPSYDGNHGLQPDQLAALLACAALPRLRSLAIASDDSINLLADSLATAPRLRAPHLARDRDHHVRGDRGSGALPRAARRRAGSPPHARADVSEHTTRLELERGPRGYARARLTIGPDRRAKDVRQQAIAAQGHAILAALPASIERITLEPRAHLAASVLTALRVAVAARLP